MPDIEIMRSQKNEVLQAIKYSELDPFNFVWGKVLSQFEMNTTVPCLRYKDSEFSFTFDLHREDHYAIYSPGGENVVDHQEPSSWVGQIGVVYDWLGNLKREMNEPDMWEQLSQFQLEASVSVDPAVENKPFTVQEVKQITLGVNRMREYLEMEFDGVENDHKLINEKLDYLIEAANRQGRRDWIHTCIGVLATLGAALGLTPEHGSKLMHFLKDAVSGVVKLLTQ